VKFLLDQHISHKLIARLADVFPNSEHVRHLGMAAVDDRVIWTHALAHDFSILTKDGDFRQLSLLRGAPPKVVWLRVGNADTNEIEALLRNRLVDLESFITGGGALLIIDP
jgi:predicted nuclease of predicted toxin-antitoxin system